MQAFRIGGIEKFHQSRQAPRLRLQSQRAAQRLIQIGRFAHESRRARTAADRRSGSRSQAFRNSTLAGVTGSCSGLKPVGDAVLQRKIFAAQRPHQDLESAILVEDHLGRALSGQHGDQESR